MSFKKLSLAFMAMFAFLCSGFVTSSYLNKALASKAQSEIDEQAKNAVKTMYPAFMNLINEGATKESTAAFFKEYFDTSAIYTSFCGKPNPSFEGPLIDFLLWRLSTATLQKVKQYSLGNNFQVISNKSKIITVKCVLEAAKDDEVELEVIFSKSEGKLGKVVEVRVLSIPLIGSAKSVMGKYYESKGIKINALPPEERAQKGCAALEDFLKANPINN